MGNERQTRADEVPLRAVDLDHDERTIMGKRVPGSRGGPVEFEYDDGSRRELPPDALVRWRW